jgi:hypothetical protein
MAVWYEMYCTAFSFGEAAVLVAENHGIFLIENRERSKLALRRSDNAAFLAVFLFQNTLMIFTAPAEAARQTKRLQHVYIIRDVLDIL